MFKLKLKASLIHLALSAIVISFVMSIIILYWFPTPFLNVSNFKEIAYILIAVDLVLGPLLTFVAFNPNKKSLNLDLSAIVTVQVMALSYGIYSLFLSHPLYVAYYDRGFSLVPTNLATPEKAKHKNFKVSKLASPTTVFMSVSEDEKSKMFTDMLNGGSDLEARAEYYEPLEKHLDTLIKNGLDPKTTFKDKLSKKKLNLFISKHGKSIDDYIFAPLTGDGKSVIWVLQKDTGKPVDIIDVLPIFTAKK